MPISNPEPDYRVAVLEPPGTAIETEAPALACAALSKRFGDKPVLSDVTFEVRPGEFVALLGPNGAGKTTLFQILTGLYTADGGKLSIAGLDLDRPGRWPAALARIGVVFQQAALDLDLSVIANLDFHAALHGVPRTVARERIGQLLERFELTERRASLCRALSGGMRRKVELARALLTAPRLLLMDEATVGLDPASRAQLLQDVHQVCRGGLCAALWATHLTAEVDDADRVIVLHRGKVLFDGAPGKFVDTVDAISIEAAFLKMTSNKGEAAGTAGAG